MKIIKVVDTRAYEEGPDDKWYPIPGSGEVNICSRCNKGHEIHVTVEDLAGRYAIVGLGCAKKDNLISETQHKGITSATISLAKNKAKLEKLLKMKEIQKEVWIKVEKLNLPEIVKGEFEVYKYQNSGGNYIRMKAIWTMEDASVVIFQDILKDEKEREYPADDASWKCEENNRQLERAEPELIKKWRWNRFRELTSQIPNFKYVENYEIEDVEFRIKKLEKKIQKLMQE